MTDDAIREATDLDRAAFAAAKRQFHRTYTDPDGPLKAAIRAYVEAARAKAEPQPSAISLQSPEYLESCLRQFGPSQDGAVERDLAAAKAEAEASMMERAAPWAKIVATDLDRVRREALEEAAKYHDNQVSFWRVKAK